MAVSTPFILRVCDNPIDAQSRALVKAREVLLQHAIYNKPDLQITIEDMFYRMYARRLSVAGFTQRCW